MENEEIHVPVSEPEKIDANIEEGERNLYKSKINNISTNLLDDIPDEEMTEMILNSEMVEIVILDPSSNSANKENVSENETNIVDDKTVELVDDKQVVNNILEDIEIVDTEVNGAEEEKNEEQPPKNLGNAPPLESMEEDPLALETDSEKNPDNNDDKIPNDTDIDSLEAGDKEQRGALKRELKSLLKSAKESKIISEFTQNTSKVRRSRKGMDISASNIPEDAEKLVRTRRSSINSNLSNSSFSSDLETKRSMRSQNPDFLVKHRRFLNKVVGRKKELEIIGISSDDESNDELNLTTEENVTTETGSTPDCSLQTSPVQEKTSRAIYNSPSDPYCWRCHREVAATPASAVHCSECVRSYHTKCLGTAYNSFSKELSDMWTCPECLAIQSAENLETRSTAMKKVTLPMMCDLLRFALKRLMDMPGVEPFTHGVDLNKFPEYPRFVVRPMDLVKMKRNVASSEYASTQAFLADVKFILHNSIVFNTQQSRLTTLAKSLIRMAKLEMSEIEACAQCYSAANTRQATWFTDVCDPPHVLLWAKLKGFPYWPAKAMTVNYSSGLVDARFFGAHDRAWVQLKDCFLYSSKDPNIIVRIKRQDIHESVREVERHIRNITRKFGVFVHAPFKTLYEPARQQEQLRMMIPSYQGSMTIQQVNKDSELKSLRPYPVIPRRRNSLPSYAARSPKTPKSGTSFASMLGYGSDDDDSVSKYKNKARKMADGKLIAAEDEIVDLDSPVKDKGLSPNGSQRTSTPKVITRKRSHNELQEANEFSIFDAKKYKTQLKNCSVRIEILEESDEEGIKKIFRSSKKTETSKIEKKTQVSVSQSENDEEAIIMEVDDEPSEELEQSKQYDLTGHGETAELEQSEKHNLTTELEQSEKHYLTKHKTDEAFEHFEKDNSSESKIAEDFQSSENVEQSDKAQQSQNDINEQHIESPQKLDEQSDKQTENTATFNDTNQMPTITNIHSLAEPNVMYKEFEVMHTQSNTERSKTPVSNTMPQKNAESNTVIQKSPISNTVRSTMKQKSPVPNVIIQKSPISNAMKQKSSVSNTVKQIPATNTIRQTPTSLTTLTNSNVFKVTQPKEPIVANMKEAMERLKQLREEVASERVNSRVGTIEVRSFARTGMDSFNSHKNLGDNIKKPIEDRLVSQPENITSTCQVKSPDASNLFEVEIKTEPIDLELNNEQRTVEKNNLLGSLQLKPTSSAQTNISSTINMQNNTISRTPDVRTMSNYKIPVTIIRKEANVTKPKPRSRKPAQKAISYNMKLTTSVIGNSSVNTNTISSNGEIGSRYPMVYIPPSAMADLAKQNMPKSVVKSNVSTNSGIGGILDSDYVMRVMSTVNSTNQNSTVATNVNNIGTATLAANSVTVSSADTPLLCAGVNQTGTQIATQMTNVLQGMVSGGQPYSIQAIPIATSINNGLQPVILSFQHTPTNNPINTNMSMPPLVNINGSDTSSNNSNSISIQNLNMNNQILGLSNQGNQVSGPAWGSGSTIAVNVGTAGSNLVVNGPLPDLTCMDPQAAATLTQGLAAALSDVMTRQGPSIQTQPAFTGNPLDPKNPPYPAPTAPGQVHKMLNEQAVKLADHFRRALEDSLSSLSVQGSPEATIRFLQLQLEKCEARHRDQIAQLKQNTESMLAETVKNHLKDIQHVRRECRINWDTEKIMAVNEAKKKQWCANCWRESQFYCCWNTSYCDYPCQQAHWPTHFSSCTQESDGTSNNESGTGGVRKPTPQIQFIRRVGSQVGTVVGVGGDTSTENGLSGTQTYTVQKRIVPRSYQPRRPNASAPMLTVAQGSVCQTINTTSSGPGGVMRMTSTPIRYSQPYFLNKQQVTSESDTSNKTTQPHIQKVALPSKPPTLQSLPNTNP